MVLVDDIVTTGTQVMAAVRTLENAFGGFHMVGFTGGYSSFGDHEGTGENLVCTLTWYEGNDHARRDYPGRT